MTKPQTERQGIGFLTNFFAEHGWLFREQPIHDYGIDAQVEIFEGDYPSGKLIAIQSKSGESHFSSHFNKESETYFEYSGIEEKHKKYWSDYLLPVIITLYHPGEKQAYWTSAFEKDFLSTGKNWKLVIKKTNNFSNKNLLEDFKSLLTSESQIDKVTKIAKKKKERIAMDEQNENISREMEMVFDLTLHELEAKATLIKESREMYEIQCSIGALAFFSDPQKSLKAYRYATELDPDNANGWNQLGNVLHLTGNPKEAIIAYQNVLKMGKKNKNPKEVAAAYNGLGTIYKYGDNNKAIEYYGKALSIGEEFEIQEIIATACENIAVVYSESRNFDEAIKQYERALEINKKLDDREGMASSYLNLGTMCYDRERINGSLNFKIATKYLNDSLSISESLKDREKIAIIYGVLGNIRKASNDFDGANDYYDKSLKINESLGRKEGVAVQYENLGNLWIEKDLDKAFNHYNDALKINEHLGIQSRIALNYANMGLVCKKQEKYTEARTYWQKSLLLYKALGSPHTKTVQGWLDALPE